MELWQHTHRFLLVVLVMLLSVSPLWASPFNMVVFGPEF